MYLGRVIGSATATVKHPSTEGWKLLLVMALQADGRTIEGDPILVVDSLGAGRGETVIITISPRPAPSLSTTSIGSPSIVCPSACSAMTSSSFVPSMEGCFTVAVALPITRPRYMSLFPQNFSFPRSAWERATVKAPKLFTFVYVIADHRFPRGAWEPVVIFPKFSNRRSLRSGVRG